MKRPWKSYPFYQMGVVFVRILESLVDIKLNLSHHAHDQQTVLQWLTFKRQMGGDRRSLCVEFKRR